MLDTFFMETKYDKKTDNYKYYVANIYFNQLVTLTKSISLLN